MEPPICLGLPETEPRSPDWRPEAPPAASPAKDGQAPWWCHCSQGAHWLSLPRVTAAGSAWSASCHLLAAVGRGVASHPFSLLPSPYPRQARGGGPDSSRLLATKKASDKCPHSLSGGKKTSHWFIQAPGTCPLISSSQAAFSFPEGTCSLGQGARALAH